MASCTDLTKLPPSGSIRSLNKPTLGPIISGKKLAEPFQRLKQRANLFRRKNFSSQLDLSSSEQRGSITIAEIIPTSLRSSKNSSNETTTVTLLKRSNSMICPQDQFPTFFKTRDHQRNSLCLDSIPYSRPSSINRYNHGKLYSKMTHIDENEVLTFEPSNEHLTNQRGMMTLGKAISRGEQQQQQQQTVVPSSTVLLRDHPDSFRPHRQSHCTTILLPQRQSICSSVDEPFYDCQQIYESPFEQGLGKVSTSTMTGKSLTNLYQINSNLSSPSPSSSLEEKGVQTTFPSTLLSKTTSSTSLSSSSSTSIQTDSLEHQSALIKHQQLSTSVINHQSNQTKWPHRSERLLAEQPCIYWVNYLGSTAIKMSLENPTVMATNAINRLKQSTQYARILPIIGLSISSRGVQFLKHTKDRPVICFHEIKAIHCACQDQDLRYFAYVTREQRLQRDSSYSNGRSDSPSCDQQADYHHYCHVFVVKNEAMSTEIMLTFGQAFDVAYRLVQHGKAKSKITDSTRSNIDHVHLPSKLISTSTCSSVHSPGSIIDEQRKPFI